MPPLGQKTLGPRYGDGGDYFNPLRRICAMNCPPGQQYRLILRRQRAVFVGRLAPIMAEREGFEPSDRLRSQRFSRPSHSAALAPLRTGLYSLSHLAVALPPGDGPHHPATALRAAASRPLAAAALITRAPKHCSATPTPPRPHSSGTLSRRATRV